MVIEVYYQTRSEYKITQHIPTSLPALIEASVSTPGSYSTIDPVISAPRLRRYVSSPDSLSFPFKLNNTLREVTFPLNGSTDQRCKLLRHLNEYPSLEQRRIHLCMWASLFRRDISRGNPSLDHILDLRLVGIHWSLSQAGMFLSTLKAPALRRLVLRISRCPAEAEIIPTPIIFPSLTTLKTHNLPLRHVNALIAALVNTAGVTVLVESDADAEEGDLEWLEVQVTVKWIEPRQSD